VRSLPVDSVVPRIFSDSASHNPGMRVALLSTVLVAVLGVPASSATPATTIAVTTWLEGGHGKHTYTLTCAPAAVRGLPPGTLRAADACAALRAIGSKLYGRSLSLHERGCNYIQAGRGALLVGTRNGRRVRVSVEVGPCERLLVPLKTLRRILVWQPTAR
jgi:hypothetical protein